MICKITIHDEVFCTLKGLATETTQLLNNKFSAYVDGYKFHPKFKLGRWDGKIRFYDLNNKTYYNLLFDIIPILEKEGYTIELDDKRKYYEYPENINKDIFAEHGVILREHQVLATNQILEAQNGFAILSTGFGKTLVTAAISKAFNNLNHNVITIVPSNDLVNQTFEWYVKCGLDVGKYCGTEKDIYHANIVSTWQSLQNNPKVLEITDIKAIIWDEAHGAKANVAKELLTTHAKNIPFKYGVTGTMPKSPSDVLSLKVAIGNIITQMSARWLMDNGYLTPVEIESFEIKEKAKENFPDYSAEKSYLAKNNDRLDVLADLIINQCEKYGNTLVLVNSIQFGEKLANMIEGAVFLHGGTSTDDRKEHYDMFETEHSLIIIATFGIASTGISIDRVMNLMMIDAGKSFVRAIQSIGRTLRQADDKDIAHVADVYSSLKWSKKHFKDRVKYYKEAEYPIVGEYSLKV